MSRFSAKRCLWPYAETITATAEHGTACTVYFIARNFS